MSDLWKTVSSQEPASLVKRARRRLKDVAQITSSKWVVTGNSKLDDSSSYYTIDHRDGKWTCSCFLSPYGDSREGRGCSHILAVKIAMEEGLCESITGSEYELSQPEPEPEPIEYEPVEFDSPDLIELPSPRELDLPPRFTEWRAHQKYALEKILNSDKRVILLDAPTGSGKSLIAAALQRYTTQKLLYVVHTKQLQDQLEEEFPYAEILKGRRNYPTANHPSVTCDACEKTRTEPCRHCMAEDDGIPLKGSDSKRCPYQKAKRRLVYSNFGVVNMALFLGEANFVGELGYNKKKKAPNWDWIVLDEGDLTERSVMGFREVYVSRRMIKQFALKHPEQKTKSKAWKVWAEETVDRLIAIHNKATNWEAKLKKDVLRLVTCLSFFATNIEEGVWVNCTEKGDENWEKGPWIFKPTYINAYAEHDVWRHGKRFLVMSATILSSDQFIRDMGLKRSDVEFIQLPSTFPAERRPIYRQPVAEMSYKKKAIEAPKMVKAVRKIIQANPDKNILVHTVSYQLTKMIVDALDDGRPTVTYNDADGRMDALEQFKASSGAVMVAPSMGRGVNLPYELCDIVILAKVPFPALGDPQIKSRLYRGGSRGREWYICQTIREMIQSSGRGMRYEDDSCEIYILDSLFDDVYKQNRRLFPKWWRAALKKTKQ